MNMTAKNSNQTSDNNNCRCECKNPRKLCAKKIVFVILLNTFLKLINI